MMNLNFYFLRNGTDVPCAEALMVLIILIPQVADFSHRFFARFDKILRERSVYLRSLVFLASSFEKP